MKSVAYWHVEYGQVVSNSEDELTAQTIKRKWQIYDNVYNRKIRNQWQAAFDNP
jgi:xylose isomerase